MEHCRPKRPGDTTGIGPGLDRSKAGAQWWRSTDLCAIGGAERGERQQGDRRGRTLAITNPQRGEGATRSSWWRVWCKALLCGLSVIPAGRFCRAIQQKSDNAASKRFFDLFMPGNWLRDTRGRISIPIVFASMVYQNASTLLDPPYQVSTLHGMTNSPTLRAPEMCPPARSR